MLKDKSGAQIFIVEDEKILQIRGFYMMHENIYNNIYDNIKSINA